MIAYKNYPPTSPADFDLSTDGLSMLRGVDLGVKNIDYREESLVEMHVLGRAVGSMTLGAYESPSSADSLDVRDKLIEVLPDMDVRAFNAFIKGYRHYAGNKIDHMEDEVAV